MSITAIFAFNYVSSAGNKVHVYLLDGSPEQHQDYLSKIDTKSQPANGFDDRDGKFPDLKGNPVYYSGPFLGNIIEIECPDGVNKDGKPRRPFVSTDELDREIATARRIGENPRSILQAYERKLERQRFSKKSATVNSTDASDEDLSDL